MGVRQRWEQNKGGKLKMEARRSVEDKSDIGNDKKWVSVMLCQLNQKTEQNKTEMQSETDQKGEK